jgi:hypothetical protein
MSSAIAALLSPFYQLQKFLASSRNVKLSGRDQQYVYLKHESEKS